MVERGNPSAKKKPAEKARPRWRQGTAKRDTFPWISSQIITVSESGSLMELSQTCQAYTSQMNLVNISTAFHRIARLWTSNEDQEAAMMAQSVVEGLIQQANTVLARASASGTKPSSQALANITWAMATLNIIDEPLLKAIATPAQSQVETFKPFELSTILWSFGKMNLANPELCGCAAQLFEAAASVVPRSLEEFTLRCLVTITWAFAAFRHKEEHLFQAIGDHLISQVHTANCGELANIAWAYGLLQVHHEKLFQEVARRANVRLQDFKQQEIATIIWGFAASDFLPAAFFGNAALAAQRLALTPQQTTNILWALTRRRCKQTSLATTVLALLPAAMKQIERFNMPEIAICSMAAAKVVKHIESNGKSGQKVSSATSAVDFCVKAMQQALSRLNELSNVMLVNLAASFLIVGCPGSVVLLAAAGREALHRLQVLENPVLLHLIRVFSVDLTALQPPALLEGACQGMFRALFAEAARRMDSFKPREMQSLSVLCAQPLGLENAGDMSAGDLRSCCFALATTGGPAHQPLTLLDQFLEEDQEIFWDPDPVEAPVARRAPASGSVNFQPAMPASVPFVQPMVGWTPLEVNAMQPGMAAPGCQGPAMSGWSQSGMPGFSDNIFPGGYPPQQDGINRFGLGAEAPMQANMERQDQPSDPRENKFVYSVKNTFLHVEDSEEEQEDLSGASQPWLSEASLGPPLQFLPKDIELNELQAFRADYMKFRAGQATGARGEIQDVPEVPLASESTVGALDLQTPAAAVPGVQ